MKQRHVFFLPAAILIAVLSAVCFRLAWVQLTTHGDGSYASSPDGTLEASASSLSAVNFWSFDFGLHGNDRRSWIEYRIIEMETGDTLFEATYHSPGQCREGNVTWSVALQPETKDQLEERKKRAELENVDPRDLMLPPIQTVTFDCGSKLVLSSSNAIDWFVKDKFSPKTVGPETQ